MANLTLTAPFSFDTVPDWNWTRSTTTAAGFTFTNGSQQTITLGGSFVATEDFSIKGKVTDVTFTQSGADVFKVTGLGLDAATLSNLVDNVADAHQTFAYLLGGDDTIKGSSGADQLSGFDGNDIFFGSAGNDSIDGGAGSDSVRYTGSIADFKIERTADGGVSVTDLKGGNGTDILHHVEEIQFADKAFLPVDVNGASGQLFRLYHAALDRTPDDPGMIYWEAQMEKDARLESIASDFINSAEYQKLYGTGHTNAELVGEYYQHILGRAGEQAGIDFWAGVLDSHAATNAQVLAAISDSPENVQHSVTLIGTGLVVDAPILIS